MDGISGDDIDDVDWRCILGYCPAELLEILVFADILWRKASR